VVLILRIAYSNVMRILIVSDAWHPQLNGVVRTYKNLSEQLEKLGHKMRVVGPNEFKCGFPLPSYKEIRITFFQQGRLKKILSEFKPDHIHVATEGNLGRAMRRICLKMNIPFTTTYHTHFPDYIAKRLSFGKKDIYKILHKKAVQVMRDFHGDANLMFVATQSLEDELKSWGFKTPMHRLVRGVDLSLFAQGNTQAKRLKFKKPVALYVGRVAVEKNLEAFLDMDWHGDKVIVGDGPALEELKRKYKDAIFVGRQTGKDLVAHYKAADIFVFPSKTDTFGIVLIEALAAGVPVAAYPVTGPKDIIIKDYLGCLKDDLATAAEYALKAGDPEKCKKHVRDNYTWDKVALQFLDGINIAKTNAKEAA